MNYINNVWEEGKEFIVHMFGKDVRVICEGKEQLKVPQKQQARGNMKAVRVTDKKSEFYMFTTFITSWEVVAEC